LGRIIAPDVSLMSLSPTNICTCWYGYEFSISPSCSVGSS